MVQIEYPLRCDTWDNKEVEAIHDVIRSGRVTMGPHVRNFEKLFAEYFGSRYAVMVNSGSSANLIGIMACLYHSSLNLAPGDEVIVPAVSWGTTFFPVQQAGLKLRFIDVDPETLNLDLDLVRGLRHCALARRVRAYQQACGEVLTRVESASPTIARRGVGNPG